jgi:pimeloyl-[acyl-carrier protein] methyl ester esterase
VPYPRLALLSGWGIDRRIWQSLEGYWPRETEAQPIDWPGYSEGDGDTPALPANATMAQLAPLSAPMMVLPPPS